MYLLKRGTLSNAGYNKLHSHSTMYLLKQRGDMDGMSFLFDSHSTMYLLKPKLTGRSFDKNTFTFHHVSIKTNRDL